MIELHDVTFAYPGHAPVFERFHWSVGRGDVWAVLGPSGCGKSTLLMLLAGLLPVQSGHVIIDGLPITRPRPRTGLILQEYGLLPWATVYQNAALGLKIRRFYGPDGQHVPTDARMDEATLHRHVAHWLARLDIAGVAEKFPGQISGGQRQRTAIARTLALAPDLLLMDEPFAALDAPTREGLQQLLLDLRAEAGLTVVLVTHNIEEAAFVGQNILRLTLPPNRDAMTIANPHSAAARYRDTVAYQAMCTRLRHAL